MQTPEVIYLIDHNGDNLVWCEEPAPEPQMNADNAIKYIRADRLVSVELKE